MNLSTAGNKGKGVRSDCFITLELTKNEKIEISITSKVKALFGKQIEKEVLDILSFFNVKGAKVTVEDSGATALVIAARMEACIKKLIKTDKEYLLPFLPQNQYHTEKERHRFSRLYLPGNTPSLAINAGIHHPDGVILDLEDAVAPDKKFEAQFLVRNMLRGIIRNRTTSSIAKAGFPQMSNTIVMGASFWRAHHLRCRKTYSPWSRVRSVELTVIVAPASSS